MNLVAEQPRESTLTSSRTEMGTKGERRMGEIKDEGDKEEEDEDEDEVEVEREDKTK